MSPERLKAFSDGVIAIIITIMVLELKVPEATDLPAILGLAPVFFCYVLSYIYIGIYWNNHHHMMHTARHITGAVLWANLHLLFWLSLIPFFTAWMGEHHFAALPTAFYGGALAMSALSYAILSKTIVAADGKESLLQRAIGKDCKGILSLLAYIVAVPLSFVNCFISVAIYIFVALVWIVPDKRIEKLFKV